MTVADSAALNVMPYLAGNLKWAESQSGGRRRGRCKKPSALFQPLEIKDRKRNRNYKVKGKRTKWSTELPLCSSNSKIFSLPSESLERKHGAEKNPAGLREEVVIPSLVPGESYAWLSYGHLAPMGLPGELLTHCSFPSSLRQPGQAEKFTRKTFMGHLVSGLLCLNGLSAADEEKET